jgi:hypothetical protein
MTYFCNLLLKQIERLEAANARTKAAVDDKSKGMSEEYAAVLKECERLRELLAQQTKVSPNEAKLAQEVNDLKNLIMIKDTINADLTSRVRDLETEMENRAKGVNTQYRYLSGRPEEDMLVVQEENQELRSKNFQMSVESHSLCKCANRSKPTSQPADTQTVPFPRRITRVSNLSIPVKPSSDHEIRESLLEQLRKAKADLALSKAQLPASSSESDYKQSKALYRILTESWIYTDCAMRNLKVLFDRQTASLELKIADRDLRIAHLEYQEYMQPSKIRLDELENKAKENERMVKEMLALQAALATRDAEVSKLKADIKSEKKRLTKEFEDQLRAQQKPAGAELRSAVEALQEDLREKQKTWAVERQEWEEERGQLQETVLALEGQLSNLKDLRKPLPPVSKRK